MTPTDDAVVIGRGPGLFDEADRVDISVTFTWDIPYAESLAFEWQYVAPVTLGGPAFNDPGSVFVPGKYLKNGCVITSRGCPNHCWFCRAWRQEGPIRELQIQNGWNLLDNNILACSRKHQEAVFAMLARQSHRPRFTGGLEAARFTGWHADCFAKLAPDYVYFSYDTPDDYDPLVAAAKLLKNANLMVNNKVGCYVLIGYQGDTIALAEARLLNITRLGYFPQAMLYNRGIGMKDMSIWRKFQREWANKIIVGHKVATLRKG